MRWEEMIEFLGGATAIALTIGFLGQKAIEAYVNGRVEAYKSELQKLTAEHSIRFQRLHTERADVIKEIYGKIALLDDILYSTLRAFQAVGEPSLEEKVKELGVKFNELRDYFLPRRIFFEDSVCQKLDSILEIAKDIFFDITTYPVDPAHAECRFNRDVLKERHEFWEKARNSHKTEFAEVKKILEKDFRDVLGIKA